MARRTIELATFIAALLLAALAFHAWLTSHDEQQRLQSTLATQKQLIDAADARERDRNAALNDTLAQIAKLKATTQTPKEILASLQQYLQLPQPITLDANPPVKITAAKNAQARVAGIQAANSDRIVLAAGSQQASTAPRRFTDAPAPTIPASTSTQVDSAPQEIESSDAPSANTQQGTRLRQNFPAGATSESPTAARSTMPPNQLSSSSPKNATVPAATRSTLSSSEASRSSSTAATVPAADLKPLYDFVQDCRACQAQLAAAKQNSADDAAKLASLSRERDAAITAAKGGTFWRRLRRNAACLAAGAALGYAAAKR